jgi:hypothetical protein
MEQSECPKRGRPRIYTDEERANKKQVRNKEKALNHIHKWRDSNNFIITCECGMQIKNKNRYKHVKRKIHIRNLENKKILDINNNGTSSSSPRCPAD